MRGVIILLAFCCLFCRLSLAGEVSDRADIGRHVTHSEAYCNLLSQAAADRMIVNYTNNILAVCAADGDYSGRGHDDRFHANAPFQLGIIGGEDKVNRMKSQLDSLCSNMQGETYHWLQKNKLLAPVLQWVLRRSIRRMSGQNADMYLKVFCHRSAYAFTDFDFGMASNLVSTLRIEDIPPVVVLRQVFSEYKVDPTFPARPLVDYPDTHNEVTFATPFAINIVLRAPERFRKFRFAAAAIAAQQEDVTFLWIAMSGGKEGAKCRRYTKIERYGRKGYGMKPQNGYCEIAVDWTKVGRRLDVCVFARRGNGWYGPPAIISFHTLPNEQRDYCDGGIIGSIAYVDACDDAVQLFDWKNWTDYYNVSGNGQIMSIERKQGIANLGSFTADGDKIISTYPSGFPNEYQKVRYYLKPCPDGKSALQFEEYGEILSAHTNSNVRRNDFEIRR